MAIDWTVSHDERLVSAVIGEKSRRSDYPEFLAGVTQAGALSYRKIFDIRFGMLEFTVADIKAFGQRVADWGKTGKPGPTALIVNSDLTEELAALFREHARADRPIRIFTSTEAARAWLDEVAPVVPGAAS